MVLHATLLLSGSTLSEASRPKSGGRKMPCAAAVWDDSPGRTLRKYMSPRELSICQNRPLRIPLKEATSPFDLPSKQPESRDILILLVLRQCGNEPEDSLKGSQQLDGSSRVIPFVIPCRERTSHQLDGVLGSCHFSFPASRAPSNHGCRWETFYMFAFCGL